MFNRALIGKKITGIAAKIDCLESKNMILEDKRYKIRYSHRSGKRKGDLAKAWVDKRVTKELNILENKGLIQVDINCIKSRLKERFGVDYDILFEDTIKGKQLIGECDDTKPKIKKGKEPHFSGYTHNHGGQWTTLVGKDFALCYVNIGVEPTKSWMKI